MKAISTMRKEEIKAELDSHGVVYSSKDTVEELKVLLTKIRAQTATPKEPDDTTGLTSLKKEELIQKCRDYGIPFTDNAVRGDLIQKIKKHSSLTSEPKGTDIFNIGRHQGLMYRTIRVQYSEHCEWAKTTVRESGDSCRWELARFVRYLNRDLSPEPRTPPVSTTRAKKEDPVIKQEVEELKVQMKEINEKVRSANKRGSSSSSNTMEVDNNALTGIEAMLKNIMQRLENLEMRDASQSDGSWSMAKESTN